ncbi:hypothetical protein [Pendulispora albinea]|uniref:RNA polymerase sigma-70 region 2 domain-containing protein n=1 Tax=Pendulispora albinea TaxID=2741071 RepID=A0ABZ2MAG7_9BACT
MSEERAARVRKSAASRRIKGFPVTPRSTVVGVGSENPIERARSLTVLARIYWRPIYEYVRCRWRKPPIAAEEISQEFFLRALERDTFRGS